MNVKSALGVNTVARTLLGVSDAPVLQDTNLHQTEEHVPVRSLLEPSLGHNLYFKKKIQT